MGRAYCNLGLAHLALGNLETALECQKYFLAIAHMTQHLQGKFRALGNIGDVLIKMGDVEEAVKMYQRQLRFAREARRFFFVLSELTFLSIHSLLYPIKFRLYLNLVRSYKSDLCNFVLCYRLGTDL